MSEKYLLEQLYKLHFVDADDKHALSSIAGYHVLKRNLEGPKKAHTYPVVALKRLFQLAGEAAPKSVASSHRSREKLPCAEFERLVTQAKQRLAP